jgi:putative transposase
MILHVLIVMVAGWIQRHQQQVITYLQEENRILKAQFGGRRLRLTDTERRRLAVLAYPLGRQRLQEVATIATPDTLLRWYHRLIAQKFDGSHHRRHLGRPRVIEEIEQLVVRMAAENATWGYRRIQGALANLGYSIDTITVRNILRRHHLEPAPRRRQAGMSWGQFLKLHWEILAATDFFKPRHNFVYASADLSRPYRYRNPANLHMWTSLVEASSCRCVAWLLVKLASNKQGRVNSALR